MEKDKEPPRSFTVSFDGINDVIEYLEYVMENNLSIDYNPVKKEYVIDGKVTITQVFFMETMAKLSHYINVVSRCLQDAKFNPTTLTPFNSTNIPKITSKNKNASKKVKAKKSKTK